MASPETVPRDLDETTVTIIQDTPERRLAVLGEIDEAYGRDVRAGARNHLSPWPRHASAARARPHNERGPRRPAPLPPFGTVSFQICEIARSVFICNCLNWCMKSVSCWLDTSCCCAALSDCPG